MENNKKTLIIVFIRPSLLNVNLDQFNNCDNNEDNQNIPFTV